MREVLLKRLLQINRPREIVASNWNEWDKLIKMIPGKDILTTLKSKIQNKIQCII